MIATASNEIKASAAPFTARHLTQRHAQESENLTGLRPPNLTQIKTADGTGDCSRRLEKYVQLQAKAST
jgi:hypothetical protein